MISFRDTNAAIAMVWMTAAAVACWPARGCSQPAQAHQSIPVLITKGNRHVALLDMNGVWTVYDYNVLSSVLQDIPESKEECIIKKLLHAHPKGIAHPLLTGTDEQMQAITEHDPIMRSCGGAPPSLPALSLDAEPVPAIDIEK